MCFAYNDNGTLVILTADCKLGLIKYKDETHVVLHDISTALKGAELVTANPTENSLILITREKQVFVVDDLELVEPRIFNSST